MNAMYCNTIVLTLCVNYNIMILTEVTKVVTIRSKIIDWISGLFCDMIILSIFFKY